ncbi:tryptophan--tRNA ligase, mitochondrial-like [Paramacrobiotus metropolitanus]|uniref:tryptophan--tRNA ligase, mitochondrial-like n=1 Tax=Paramacrobiotus metropolitanus TaxID=2943436 RepID=UPI002446434A|nr:tryptophan--tRNA ligase, mitochondrial-like [Paramacrobiotus metropolitanus]
MIRSRRVLDAICSTLLRPTKPSHAQCLYSSTKADDIPENAAKEPKRTVVFSGIQPTGALHLGNYLGAVKLWKDLQEHSDKSLIISVVDLHAITMRWDPQILRKNIMAMFAQLVACGIDPAKTILFLQSTVPEHCQLQWIFSCITTLARIDNLPHFKEKSAPLQPKKHVEGQPLPQIDAGCGLLMYPILQAADILLYRSQLVPVGEDQVHHLQLAQHIARVFNNKHGKYFPQPQRLHSEQPRVKSLRDPTKKMSKSDTDVKSRVDVTDTPEQIHEKLRKAVTDSTSALTHDPESRPALANLISLYATVTDSSVSRAMQELQHSDKVAFKARLADAIITMLFPIQQELQRLEADAGYLQGLIENGREKARLIAQETMHDVLRVVGCRDEPVHKACHDPEEEECRERVHGMSPSEFRHKIENE